MSRKFYCTRVNGLIPVFLLFFLVLFIHDAAAQQRVLSGRLYGMEKEPLPFANVYLKGTSTGTTTNASGYYKLEIPDGSVEVVYRYLGYKLHVERISAGPLSEPVDITLQPEQYTLSTVTISPDAEDPAYEIIRHAIDKRKFYLNQVDEFSCSVYIKGLQRILKHPKKFMGVEVDLSEFVDSTTGIVYLSESVSKYYFKKPDYVKEEMISSKVSGSNKAFSFNQASDMQFNFYENIMLAGGLSPRGFISPIANNALFYYRYRLEGTYVENGRTVNKISVIPRRKSDPVFSGTIYIQDSTWRIHSTDLFLTKDAQIEILDTLRINQVFIPAVPDESVWMVGSVTFRFVFRIFGFFGDGDFVGVFSNYAVNPSFEKKFFKGPVLKINEDSNKRDSSYWEKIRPIPLTVEESVDYRKRDSMQVIKESKPYQDSLDRKSNKFKGNNLIYGYTLKDRYSKTEWTFSSLLNNIQFNTVEGLTLGMDIGFEKEFEHQKSIESDLSFHYGFSNYKWNAVAGVRYNYDPRKFAYVSIDGGDDLVQFNGNKPITPFINTWYTLIAEKNYMKLYRRQFIHAETGREVLNGLRLRGGVDYSVRTAQQNHTDYTFSDKDNRVFTSNNPVDPSNDALFFEKNEAFQIHASARIRFRQEYIDHPDRTVITGSKWPEFIVSYKTGVHGFISSDVDYDYMEFGIEDELSLGMFGTFSYRGAYGKFLNSKKMYFMEFSHYMGNRTVISSFETNRFEMLDYYKYSTDDEHIELFARHDFGGFILNKIPLLRKLKLNEIAGARYLYVPEQINYWEVSIGVTKLNLFRADVVFSFDDNGVSRTGWVFGVQTTIGN